MNDDVLERKMTKIGWASSCSTKVSTTAQMFATYGLWRYLKQLEKSVQLFFIHAIFRVINKELLHTLIFSTFIYRAVLQGFLLICQSKLHLFCWIFKITRLWKFIPLGKQHKIVILKANGAVLHQHFIHLHQLTFFLINNLQWRSNE